MTEYGLDLRGVLAIGTVLRGYKVDAVLGYGGYGVVYRALHEELRHPVAIKEYLPTDLSVREDGTVHPRSEDCREHYEDGKRRFLAEARQIAGLKDDPGVVRCTDFFRANGTAYLVMEYVEGLPLSELLKQREAAGRPFDESDLRMLAIPLLETLSRLHSAGLLHRDIKPSNILVRRADGRPVLIDFGAAKQVTERHSKSAAPFTEGYAALEQVGDGQLGPWTDVYAIGAVMWRIVAGANPPWKPPIPKPVELRASAVLDGKPDPLPSAAELGAGRFSRAVLKAVDQCLVVSADKRPMDFEELRTALEETGRPERLPDPPVPPVADQRPSHKWLVAALLTVGVVIAGLWFASEGIGTTGGGASRAELSTGGHEVSPESNGVEVWTSGVGMEFVRIPAGEFLMGSDSNLAYDDERPVTRVRIRSAFWMGKYEVTQQQWKAVMGTNPSRFENCGPDCPVEWVSWDDVQGFVQRLNAMEGTARYRLPTEAEWEYAARAGTSTDTPAGNLQILGERNAPPLDGIAWYGGNSGVDYAGAWNCLDWEETRYLSSRCGPHPVGEKDPNAFGLHDMLGNVQEWVRDWYGEYPAESLTDPNGPARGSSRVFRGCGWFSSARHCRSSLRDQRSPRTRNLNLGFRLLRTD